MNPGAYEMADELNDWMATQEGTVEQRRDAMGAALRAYRESSSIEIALMEGKRTFLRRAKKPSDDEESR